MLPNNNNKILTRMAKRSLKSNKRKNMIMIIAVILSTFLLFTILTAGSTFLKMQQLQDIRLNGIDMDAMVYGGITEQQRQVCEEDPAVEQVGCEVQAGWAESTDKDDTLSISFFWSDEAAWEMMEPARTGVKGTYPEKINEIMVTEKGLEECGLAGLGIGDSFTMTYQNRAGSAKEEFIISGIWDGYGGKNKFYVSEAFKDAQGFQISDPGRGYLYLKYKFPIITKTMQKNLEEKLELDKLQMLQYTGAALESAHIIFGLLGLILITCISAYLLIYNILYLSVSGNVRYYGLLQTVGMTGRQVYALMYRQMLLIGTIGIAAGLVLGCIAAFFLIPWIVRTLGIRQEEIAVVFSPLIMMLSILLAAGTIYLGCRKPAKMATAISPIEALGYRGLDARRKTHKTGKRNVIWRMAGEQFKKDKKKTLIVVLSLTASMSVFLCLVTLISSQGSRTMMSSWMDTDLVLENDTVGKEDKSDWKPVLEEDCQTKLRELEGISQTHIQLVEKIVIPWEAEFMDLYMKKFYERWMIIEYDKTDYQQNPEKYYSYMMGIDREDFEYLNTLLDTPVEEDAFLNGEICILYDNRLQLTEQELAKKHISGYAYDHPDESWDLQIGGVTDEREFADLVGFTPTVIVSNDYMKQTFAEPFTGEIGIEYKEEYDADLEREILNIMDTGDYPKDYAYTSKLELAEEVMSAQGNMMGIGIGIAVILGLIGIMNYINTVSGSIQSRQMEMAVMESVGMTENQVKKMLIGEGIRYAGASLILTMTLGLGVTYGIYQSMNYMGVAFQIPLFPLLLMFLSVTGTCILIPLLAYHMLGKQSLVQRIRRVD